MTTTRGNMETFRSMALEVHLLPALSWNAAWAIQNQLVYEVSGEPRRRAALILCEHFPIVTVGRQGSRGHIHLDDAELVARGWPVRWTNRGGGCWLHLPGQLLAYPILPLDPDHFGLSRLRGALYQTVIDVLEAFDIHSDWNRQAGGVWVGGREIASVGCAVKNWVSYHGCRLNISAPLHAFARIQSNPNVAAPMTSMLRERRLPVRTTAVRESFVRNFTRNLGFREFLLCNPPVAVHTPRVHHVAGRNR